MESNEKQLAKLIKSRDKKDYKIYPLILVLMIVLVHLLDTYASDVFIKAQSFIVNDFFVIGQGLTYEEGLQKLGIVSVASFMFMFIAPFYKSLMDIIGRKPLFIINTLGMSVGLAFAFFADTFALIAIGQILVMFFTMHDMQML